jgi:hypothetical protein
VHPLKGQRGSYGRQPSLAPLTKRIGLAVSEVVSPAQHTHQDKEANVMPLCSREPPWWQSAMGTPYPGSSGGIGASAISHAAASVGR